MSPQGSVSAKLADELFLRTSHGLLPTPRARVPIKQLLSQAEGLLDPEAFDASAAETTD